MANRGCSIFPADPLESYQQAVEKELEECFAPRQGFLYNLLRYHLGWVDQQGQPESGYVRESFQSLLAPAVCEALTGQYGPSLPMAAAVELAHNYTQVHADVQAGRVDAGSRPSIWWIWGPAQAINAGDGFHAMARVALLRMLEQGISPEEVLAAAEMLDRSCLAMCEGQFADLGFQDRLLVTIADYDDMIANKAGALAGCAAAGGALAAGADLAIQEKFRQAGAKLGMAWQISRDVLDFWGLEGDGVTASNLLNKKKSLPLIHAMENCSTQSKRELGSIYMKRVLEPSDLTRIIDIMENTGSRSYSQERASRLASEALEAFGTEDVPIERQEGLKALAARATSLQSTGFNK